MTRRLRIIRVLVALTALAIVAIAPAVGAVGPALSLSPSTGPVGARVTVTGTGFAGKAQGTVHYDTQSVATFRTNPKGDFSTSFVVPSLPGVTAVSVTATAGTASASSTFTPTSTTVTTAPSTTTTTTVAPPPPPPSSALTWRPPGTAGYTPVTIGGPGTYNLYSDVDYVVSAPSRIDGAVHLRGGRNVVWIGGHIHIPYQGPGPVNPANRRGLVISDIDDGGGDPVRYGYSRDGRVVHIEGLLIDGPDLADGINTNAPKAVVQLQNIRVHDVHFRNSDDRDGTNGWAVNHPDVLQTWGSQKQLRVDGLTGTSAYQGLFLREDSADRALGPMYLRRVNIRAYQHAGDDGYSYAGHRMINWLGSSIGTLHLDTGTVWVGHHTNSGWNQAKPNPSPTTSFWRVRYWNAATSTYVIETPPGGAVFTDALGTPTAITSGSDALGSWARWSSTQVRNWDSTADGRVYSGTPPQGDYVPAGTVGLGYVSPGYAA
jgi:hypothetical protein